MSASYEILNYVNGSWTNPAAFQHLDVIDPATGERIAQTPLSEPEDVTLAIKTAEAAFPAWRRTPPEERIQFLFQLKQVTLRGLQGGGTRYCAFRPFKTAKSSITA